MRLRRPRVRYACWPIRLPNSTRSATSHTRESSGGHTHDTSISASSIILVCSLLSLSLSLQAIGLAFDLTSALGNVRSKRYSFLIEDGRASHTGDTEDRQQHNRCSFSLPLLLCFPGIVRQINVEPESAPTGLTCSLASAIKV